MAAGARSEHSELFAQMSYEGHPCLWHLLLMPLAKLGLPYVSMNILSLTIMSVAAALFLWKSPLLLPMKALALFGFAFSTITRWSPAATASSRCLSS